MKILIIRHGEPDYKRDSLTEKGWREAECLADYLAEMLGGERGESTYFYVSPYGRAKNTASLTLKKLGIAIRDEASGTTQDPGDPGRTAEVLPWLKEFDVYIRRPDVHFRKHVPWDWLPQDWMQDQRFYQADHWFENERMAASNVGGEYRKVTEQFDALLAKHGYVREGGGFPVDGDYRTGGYYRVERPNHDTIVLFCHFGLEGVLLSHLWGVSPVPVWHGTCAQASSITTLVTEERREGIALFRMLTYGDITHLYRCGEEPSLAARFCECYTDDTRHD